MDQISLTVTVLIQEVTLNIARISCSTISILPERLSPVVDTDSFLLWPFRFALAESDNIPGTIKGIEDI